MMFQGKDFKNISGRDILDLIAERVAEDTTLEYKREPWKNDTEGREELIKDVSAMANSQGGYIVVGVNTTKDSDCRDIPQGTLFSVKRPNRIAQGICDRCRKYIDPAILGFDIRVITVNKKSPDNILLIYIPESDRRPHACITDKATIYVQRQGHVTTPLSVHEIETLRNASAIPRLTDFMEEIQLKLGRLESKLDGIFSWKATQIPGDLSSITDPDQLLKLSRDRFIGEE